MEYRLSSEQHLTNEDKSDLKTSATQQNAQQLYEIFRLVNYFLYPARLRGILSFKTHIKRRQGQGISNEYRKRAVNKISGLSHTPIFCYEF